MPQPIISFNNVSKRYPGGREALSGINLDVEPGEFVLLTGHSGAGKSTLLKLIAAIERVSGGTLLVNGQNVSSLGGRGIPYLRRNLGLVFQDQKLLFDRNVFENVMLPMRVTGQPPGESTKRVRAALDKVGLLAREKAMPIALSGGEQQRLAIARAVVSRPNLLLADEPTAHLDAETAKDVAQIFRDFHQVGVTVVVATYDVALFADARRVMLGHGRLVSAA